MAEHWYVVPVSFAARGEGRDASTEEFEWQLPEAWGRALGDGEGDSESTEKNS